MHGSDVGFSYRKLFNNFEYLKIRLLPYFAIMNRHSPMLYLIQSKTVILCDRRIHAEYVSTANEMPPAWVSVLREHHIHSEYAPSGNEALPR